MKRSNLSLLFSTFLLLMITTCSYSQSESIDIFWTDTNPFPVTFNVFEVSSPPDTNVILNQINFDPISDVDSLGTWSFNMTCDDSTHFFRMNACRYDTLFSDLSNTSSIYLFIQPNAPHIFKLDFN